jgi:protein TonB
VEEMPTYPGGYEAIPKFIDDNKVYPPQAIERGINGTVVVRYVVNTEGKISNVRVQSGVHPLLDQEAIRVVKTISGFQPGRSRGELTPVMFYAPVKFTIPEGGDPVNSHFDKATRHYNLGESELGDMEIDSALAFGKDWFIKGYGIRAERNAKLKRYDLALKDLDVALGIDPTGYHRLLQRGGIHQILGNHLAALADFENATKVFPQSDLAHYQLGKTQIELGLWEQAENTLSQPLDWVTTNNKRLCMRGVARMNQGKIDQACQDWFKVKELNDRDYHSNGLSKEEDGVPYLVSHCSYQLYSEVDTTNALRHVDTEPRYPGGDQALADYLNLNFRNVSGTKTGSNSYDDVIWIEYVVDRDGSVRNVKLNNVTSIVPELELEANRVMRSIRSYTPGIHRGVAVPVELETKILIPPKSGKKKRGN